MSTSSDSKMSWLRAALLAPLVIIAMMPIAGRSGHVYVPFDAISGGEAFWLMAAMHAFFMCGMFLYLAGLLILYMLLIIGGSGVWRTKARPLVILLLVMAGGFVLNHYVDKTVRAEIAATQLATETIRPGNWNVRICGSRKAICLSIEGVLGRAGLKSYIGNAQATVEAFNAWEIAAQEKTAITVEWGRTPVGWNAVRTASSGKLKLRNDWI